MLEHYSSVYMLRSYDFSFLLVIWYFPCWGKPCRIVKQNGYVNIYIIQLCAKGCRLNWSLIIMRGSSQGIGTIQLISFVFHLICSVRVSLKWLRPPTSTPVSIRCEDLYHYCRCQYTPNQHGPAPPVIFVRCFLKFLAPSVIFSRFSRMWLVPLFIFFTFSH